MGIWGMGIFANDGALDFLDEVVNDFARRTSTALGLEIRGDDVIEVKSLAQIEIADIDHIVLPSVAILVRLCGASDSRRDPVNTWSATPPASRVVRAWREQALAAFAANVRNDMTSADYRDERPAMIKQAFDELEALALAAEQGQR